MNLLDHSKIEQREYHTCCRIGRSLLPAFHQASESDVRVMTKIVDDITSTPDPATAFDGASMPPFRDFDRRENQRIRYQQLVTLRIPDDPMRESAGDAEECQVWAHDLSLGGISFVYPHPLTQRNLQIALDLRDGTTIWFHAEIVHSRPLEDGDGWEFGAAFREQVGLRKQPR